MHLLEIWHSKKNDCRLSRTQVIRNMERHLRCKTQHVGSLFYVDIMSEIVFKRYQIWILEIKILKKLSF